MRFGHRHYTKDNPPNLEKMKASSGMSPHGGDMKQLLYSPTTGAIGMTSKSQGIMDFYNKYGDVIPIYLDDGSYGYVSTSRGTSKLDYSDYQDYMASSLYKDRPKKGIDKHGSGQVGNNFGYNIYIKQKGGEGYRINASGYNDPYKVIPSGNITMTEQDGGPLKKGPLLGIDNMGNQQMMFPGYNYVFPGDEVMEIPVAQKGIEPPDALEKAMIKNAIARNSNIPFVKRMVMARKDSPTISRGYDPYGVEIKSSHELGSYGNVVLPNITQDGSGLKEISPNWDNDEIYDYHRNQGFKDAMYFKDPKDAIVFGEKYRFVAPAFQKKADEKTLYESDFNVGDEVDYQTMMKLKELGYEFKKQKGGEFQRLVSKYTTKGWQSLTDQEKQTYKEMYQQYK